MGHTGVRDRNRDGSRVVVDSRDPDAPAVNSDLLGVGEVLLVFGFLQSLSPCDGVPVIECVV